MYDYQDKIKAFIQQNFTPATANNANVKLTTNGLLLFLWNAFPVDCISDYSLVEILEDLGYSQTMYIGFDEEKNKPKLELGWCLKAPFDLGDEILK